MLNYVMAKKKKFLLYRMLPLKLLRSIKIDINDSINLSFLSIYNEVNQDCHPSSRNANHDSQTFY